MVNDLYDSESDATQSKPPADMGDMEGGPTGLLPKDFFVGKEPTPGSICSVQIVKVYDDQVEVKYISHDQEEGAEGPEDMGQSEPASDDSDLMG